MVAPGVLIVGEVVSYDLIQNNPLEFDSIESDGFLVNISISQVLSGVDMNVINLYPNAVLAEDNIIPVIRLISGGAGGGGGNTTPSTFQLIIR
jgi:purine-cytosine permease-like protein